MKSAKFIDRVKDVAHQILTPSKEQMGLSQENYHWWLSKNKGKFFIGPPSDKEVTEMRLKDQKHEITEQQIQDWIKKWRSSSSKSQEYVMIPPSINRLKV